VDIVPIKPSASKGVSKSTIYVKELNWDLTKITKSVTLLRRWHPKNG
jgi:hypothetical protein